MLKGDETLYHKVALLLKENIFKILMQISEKLCHDLWVST